MPWGEVSENVSHNWKGIKDAKSGTQSGNARCWQDLATPHRGVQ